MLNRCEVIEGEFFAAAIVNHGRSLPQERDARGRNAGGRSTAAFRTWLNRAEGLLAPDSIGCPMVSGACRIHDGDLRLAVVFVGRLRHCHIDGTGSILHRDQPTGPAGHDLRIGSRQTLIEGHDLIG